MSTTRCKVITTRCKLHGTSTTAFYTTVRMSDAAAAAAADAADDDDTVTDVHGVFARERSAGLYRLSAYYLAMMTTEIPVTFLLTTMYVCVVYWMVNLSPSVGNFIAHWMILEVSTFTAQVSHRATNITYHTHAGTVFGK